MCVWCECDVMCVNVMCVGVDMCVLCDVMCVYGCAVCVLMYVHVM